MNVSFLGVSFIVSHYLRGLCNCGKVHFIVIYRCDNLRFSAVCERKSAPFIIAEASAGDVHWTSRNFLACA